MNALALPVLALSLFSTSLFGESWSQFRGPDGSAVLESGTKLTVEWSDSKNIRWKIALPGPGSSSPVFWGNKLFVTCYVGYGTNIKEPGDPENLGRQLICLDRESGKILWQKTIALANPEDDYRGYIMEHGYASSTPATDGENVYAFFGKSGVHAFTIDGEPLWSQQVGKESSIRRWGSGASPILFEDLLIVNAADEGRALIAFDKKTGKERWRRESKALELDYSTPQIRKTRDGTPELIFALAYEVWGLNPNTGEPIWTTKTEMPGNFCASVVMTQDMVFAFGGHPKKSSIGIKDGKVLWTVKPTSYVPTPLEFKGHLYWVDDDGEAICMEAATGKIITKRTVEGLEGGKARSFYASIVRVGDKFIAVSRRSGTFVFEANPDMKQLSKNLLGDASDFNATPALAESTLYLRSDKFVYAIGK